jgi:hypothetical protein
MKNKFSLVFYPLDQRLVLEYLIDEGKRAGAVEMPKDIPFVELLRNCSMYASLYSSNINVLVVPPNSERSEATGPSAQPTIEQLLKQREVLLTALNEIATWSDGDTVGSHFDEPGSAATARLALTEAQAIVPFTT